MGSLDQTASLFISDFKVEDGKMNKKIKASLIISLIVLLLSIASVCGNIIYGYQFEKTYAANYENKLARLKELDESKAVFIGGSSCLFGVHSSTFEQEMGMPTVNMAISAGIPMKFYLDSVFPYLNAGDKLFLCYEYGYYGTDWNLIGESGINFLLYQDGSVFSKQNKLNLLKATPEYLTVGWKNWENFAQEWVKTSILGGYGVYRRDSINTQGDMIAHKDLSNESTIEETVIPEYLESTIINFEKYISAIKAKGVDIYIGFQPVSVNRYENSKHAIEDIYERLSSIDGIKILGLPTDYVYPIDCFFDSENHLDYSTGCIHTTNLLRNYEEGIE